MKVVQMKSTNESTNEKRVSVNAHTQIKFSVFVLMSPLSVSWYCSCEILLSVLLIHQYFVSLIFCDERLCDMKTY